MFEGLWSRTLGLGVQFFEIATEFEFVLLACRGQSAPQTVILTLPATEK